MIILMNLSVNTIMVQVYKFTMSTFSMLTIHMYVCILDAVRVKTLYNAHNNPILKFVYPTPRGDIRMLSYQPRVRQIITKSLCTVSTRQWSSLNCWR